MAIPDDQLRLNFTYCHRHGERAQVPLTLLRMWADSRTDRQRIARAFSIYGVTMAQQHALKRNS